jgi:hypothetical protein
MPYKPSNSNFSYIEEGKYVTGHTFTHVWDILLALGARHLSITSHSKDNTLTTNVTPPLFGAK